MSSLDCKLICFFGCSCQTLANFFFRTSDDDALRAKVDEAMAVYNEYVKNSQQDEAPQANGAENLNPSAEEVKDPEA